MSDRQTEMQWAVDVITDYLSDIRAALRDILAKLEAMP